jgi:hypothetical protein
LFRSFDRCIRIGGISAAALGHVRTPTATFTAQFDHRCLYQING